LLMAPQVGCNLRTDGGKSSSYNVSELVSLPAASLFFLFFFSAANASVISHAFSKHVNHLVKGGFPDPVVHGVMGVLYYKYWWGLKNPSCPSIFRPFIGAPFHPIYT